MRQNNLIPCFLVGVLFLTGACDQVYFSTSQPIDSKNIYSFPKKFRGVWTEDGDSVVIGKDYFMNIDYNDKKVAKTEVDTSASYVLRGDKIYQIDDGQELKVTGGFSFVLKNDTISYQEREVFEIAFGKTAFLRRVGDSYIINMKHKNEWWEIGLIEYTSDNRVLVRYINFDDLDSIPNITSVYTTKNEKYLDVAWTQAELLKIINRGGFSDTLFNLEISKRYRLPKK